MINEWTERKECNYVQCLGYFWLLPPPTAGSNELGGNESCGFSMFRCFPELTVYLFAGFSRKKLTDFYSEKYVLQVNLVNLNHTNQQISIQKPYIKRPK